MYTIKIRKYQTNEKYKGFVKDVYNKISSTGGISNDFIPVYNFTKFEDKNLDKLRIYRNYAITYFLIALLMLIVIPFLLDFPVINN